MTSDPLTLEVRNLDNRMAYMLGELRRYGITKSDLGSATSKDGRPIHNRTTESGESVVASGRSESLHNVKAASDRTPEIGGSLDRSERRSLCPSDPSTEQKAALRWCAPVVMDLQFTPWLTTANRFAKYRARRVRASLIILSSSATTSQNRFTTTSYRTP